MISQPADPRHDVAERAPRATTAAFDPWERRVVLGVLVLYLALHFATRLLMAPTLGVDDAEQALFAQSWSWGYRLEQPPLFTWLLVGLSYLMAVDIVALSVLRYLLLGLCYLFIYLTARRIIADRRLAALAMYSFAAIYVFAYYAHHDLTHTTILATSIAAAFYVFVRLAQAPRWEWYALFGLVCALGVLSKWNFVMTAAALAIACLIRPGYRPLVLNWRTLVAAAVAAVVLLGPMIWVHETVASYGQVADDVLGAGQRMSWVQTLVSGTLALAGAALAFPQPFVVVYAAIFGPTLLKGAQRRHGTAGPPPVDAGFLATFMIVGLLLHWLLVPILGAVTFNERWMHPVLMALPLYLFALLDRRHPSGRQIVIFAVTLAALVAVAWLALVGRYLLGADYCGRCRALAPYETLATQLRAAGIDGGTIVTQGFHVGGNLRVHFPESRVIDARVPHFPWPSASAATSGQCVAIWHPGEDGERAQPPAAIARLMDWEFALARDDIAATGEVSALMIGSSTRSYSLQYALFDGTDTDCR